MRVIRALARHRSLRGVCCPSDPERADLSLTILAGAPPRQRRCGAALRFARPLRACAAGRAAPCRSPRSGSALRVTGRPDAPAGVRSEIGTGPMDETSAQREGVNVMGTSVSMQMTGFVGSDPQVRQVGEQRVASFSVAVSRKSRSGCTLHRASSLDT